jgi:lysophospholipase L1-like esterase
MSFVMSLTLAQCIAVFLGGQRTGATEVPFELAGGERVVFFGDSITQAGGYLVDLEAFLLTRFPDKTFVVFNHGRSSETISGTSEPDHQPRRPDAHLRFTRDVADWKPDIVVACFGMNDGNYHPFEPERFARFQAGIERLISRTRNEAHARLVLLSPPPFDPYRRLVSDADAVAFGYKFPAIDYDQTLEHYGQWLLTLASRERGPMLVDVHGKLNNHLKRRREDKVSFYLAGDGVHPGPTGHWLMAQALLLAWHAPAQVDEMRVVVSDNRPQVSAGAIRALSLGNDHHVSFIWRSPLPFPFDPGCDRHSLEIEQVASRLNRYRMTITGLPNERYRLLASIDRECPEVEVANVTRAQLEAGLDLTGLERFPTVVVAQAVRSRLVKYRQAVNDEWRHRLDRDPTYRPDQASAEYRGDGAELAEIRRLCRPRDVRIELVPLE